MDLMDIIIILIIGLIWGGLAEYLVKKFYRNKIS